MEYSHRPRVVAVVGSYRKGGIVDTTVDEVLASARENGAEVTKIYLLDKHIEFCTNCRSCTQRPGRERGRCTQADDLTAMLDELETCDGIVLGSPMNFGTVTAVMKRFIERLIGYAYWPWGMKIPKLRNKDKTKRAIIVTSSAAPSLLGRLITQIVGLLKQTAAMMGARTSGVLYIGLAAGKEKQEISPRIRKKARKLGRKLAYGAARKYRQEKGDKEGART